MPCIQTKCGLTGTPVNVLIDTGSTNNYINKICNIGKSIKIKPFKTKTLHGFSIINSKKVITMYGHHLTFFEINELDEFDMILGEQGLRHIKAEINLFDYSLKYQKKIVPKIEPKINYTINNEEFKVQVGELMQKNNCISETLPFTTTIQASIRTESEDPIWTKQYPYPMADHDFVRKEIEKLLKDGIIQPSKSPYNSPIWTVPKKGTDDHGKPKRRMVVDFQKINAHTITDRYPIPDVNMTIQNLGKAKIFSTIDLESGFHQILIKESDREKTAFSVNGAKYEFIRMPFGLKNAPSIFQRCVDDILREYIGKFAYVYIDDVLIYSSTPEEHMEHLRIIINALHNANMKISDEKSNFFQDSIEYLGHIIKHNRITVDPNKIETIKNYPEPKNLKELRSFLGLASYYRKFIKDFAKITKPLTIHLRGELGMVKKNQSTKMLINLDKAAIEALNKIKNALQEQVELFQPDFSKPFSLTTDASNFAIGAVLSQNRQPIAFISRTLNETEQNYSTNEKELLAIVWSLQKLRNYLYGVANLTIYTDHQSLIFSISEKNPNAKLKRWKNLIEEYGAKLVYKPGHQNVVADALSRQQINNTTDCSDHSQQSSPNEIIKKVKQPLNSFKNQIIMLQDNERNEIITKTTFPGRFRHTIFYKDTSDLLNKLKSIIRPKVTNALKIDEEIIFHLKNKITTTFPTCTFVLAQNQLIDVNSVNEQKEIVTQTHKRAHRNFKNNTQEILLTHFWPNIREMCRKETVNCEICLQNKYERHPNKQPIGKTPIPTHVGEYIQMDIFHMNNNIYISTTCKYSKYCYIRKLENKVNCHEYIEEILSQVYPNAKYLMTDNENIFIGNVAKSVYERLQITHTVTPLNHSTSNAQVERIHSTLIELCQTLAAENKTAPSEELFNAVRQYNKTIHSSTGYKPEEVFFNREKHPEIKNILSEKQDKILRYHNKKRQTITYKTNEIIYVKTDRRNKLAKKYNKHKVKEDRGDTILTDKGKIIHKDSIRKQTTCVEPQ